MGETETPSRDYPLHWARVDAAGRITDAGRDWQRLTATAPGEDWRRAFQPAHRKALSGSAGRVRHSRGAVMVSARLAQAPGIPAVLVMIAQGEELLLALRWPAPALHRECEPMLWRVLDSLPVGLTITNRDGQITEANLAARQLWQSAAAPLPDNLGAYTAWHDDGRRVRPEEWPAQRALQGQVTNEQILNVESFDGRRRVLLASGAPLRDAYDQISAALATYRDITELHQSQTALRESEHRLRQVLETLPVGVWFINAEGRIVSANAACYRIWEGARHIGLQEFDQYRGWWADSGKPLAAEDWAAYRALRYGETSLDELVRIETFAGTCKYISNSAAPLRDESGRIVGVVVVNQDITARLQAEEERNLLADVAASAGDAIVSTTPDGRITSWNLAAERLFGYSAAEATGQPLEILAPPDRKAQLHEFFGDVLQGRHIESEEVIRQSRSGERLELALTASPLRDRSGRITGVCILYRDIRTRKRNEETLRLWAHALASIRNGIAVLRAEPQGWRIVFVNAAFEQLTGYPAAEIVGRYAGEFFGGSAARPDLDALREALRSGDEAQVVLRSRRRDGSRFWNEVSISPVRNAEGYPDHYVAVLDDVSERVQYEEELAHQASHDALTGLPNRNLLRDRIQQALAQAHRDERSAALLFIDLDGFKHVNDSLGHEMGDLLLAEVGRRLQHCVREEDTVARLGGDEFVLVLNKLDQAQDAGRVALNTIRSLSRPFQLYQREVYIGCSIGIAAYPEDGLDDDELMRHADAAMYRAKQGGKGGFRFYSAQLDQRAGDRVALEASLRRAVEREEFLLLYQPQRDMRSGEVVGVEALLRWDHPEWGLVRPDMFIPLAEETGLIVPIGRWALQAACAQMARWRRERGWCFTVAVNLSARQFANPDKLIGSVNDALSASGLASEFLELELTESMLMREPQQVGRVLAGLKEAGIGLAIDDFGIGYSSLNYLRSFPVDKLKIDRAFIRDLGRGERPAALTASIVALGHSLELTMIGEGVETADQLEQLALTGCDQVQGYWCGRPLSATSMVEYIRDRGTAEGMRPQ